MRRLYSLLILSVLALMVTGCDELFDDLLDPEQRIDVSGTWIGKTGPVQVSGIPFPISLVTGDPLVKKFVPLKLDLSQPVACSHRDEDECKVSGEVEARAAGGHTFGVGGDLKGSELTLAGTHQPFRGTPTYTIVLQANVSSDNASLSGTWVALNPNNEVVKSGAWEAHRK